MAWNLRGGLPVVYQGHLGSLCPFRERLTPAHDKRQKGDAGWHKSAGLQNGQRGKCSDAWDEHVCKCDAHDDMIWNAYTQTNDKATTVNNWKTPGATVSGRYNTPPLREDLVPRSRMAPEGKGKRKRRGKTKLLLRQTSETMNLESLHRFEKRIHKGEQSRKHSVRKEEQGKTTSGSTPVENGCKTW